MNILNKIRTLVAVCAIIGCGTVAHAADITIAHDREPYISSFNKIAKLAGVKLEHTGYGSVDQYKAYISQSVQSDDMPDIFVWWAGKTFEELVATGKVADVSAIWDEMISTGRYPASLRVPFSVNGTAHGVPFGVVNWMVWYNKKHFATAGIESAPTTWAELEAAVQKLKAAGITPFESTMEGGWRPFIWFEELFIRTNPKAFVGLFDGTTPYDSEPVRNVFRIWSEFYADGWFTDPRATDEHLRFAGGSAGMYVWAENGPSLLFDLGMDPNNLGVFLMPDINKDLKPHVILEPAVLVMSKSGYKKEAVQKYAKAWLSAEGASLWGAETGWLPGALDADLPTQSYKDSYAVKAKLNPDQILRWWESTPAGLQMDLNSEIAAFMVNPTMEQAETSMANMRALVDNYED